jgi:antitoxin component YwqK of YwqJK toxin-antitoxin module
MNKLTILLFSILISFNSYGWFFGLFDNPICIETDGQTRGEIVYLPNEDDAFTGKSLCVYKNGKNKSESNYKDGKKDGLLTLWYENGNKKSEINFVNGERHGTRTDWYDDIRRELGQIKSTAIYKAGKQHGSQVAWHPNGKKMAETIFVNDKEDGAFIAWHDNGELKLSSYFKDGKEDGKFSLYDESSNKLAEGQYIDGEKDGTWKEWIIRYPRNRYRTSYPKTTVAYINGLKNGLETNYFGSGLYDCSYGVKQSEGYYKNGKKDGPWKYWDQVGRKRWERSDGRLDWTCKDRSNRSTEAEGMYKNGIKVGQWKEGYSIGSYVNGKKHNTWSKYSHKHLVGRAGHISSTYNYNLGVKDGLFETFNTGYGQNEKLTEERYKNGKKDGVWTTWFEMEYCYSSCEADIFAGKNIALTQDSNVYQKKSETSYKNGEKNGVEIEWGMRDDLSGYKIHQTNYKNGIKDGLYIKYSIITGNKEVEGYYQAGEKHGVWLEYHWDGELSRTQRY